MFNLLGLEKHCKDFLVMWSHVQILNFSNCFLAKITKGILKYTCERTKFYNENQLDPWFIFENIVSNPLTANVFQKFINSKISCYIYGIDQLCSGLCLGSEGALHAV